MGASNFDASFTAIIYVVHDPSPSYYIYGQKSGYLPGLSLGAKTWMIFPRFLANLTNLLCKSFRPVCHNIACRQTMLSRVSISLCRKCWNKSRGSLISSKTPFPDPLFPKNNKQKYQWTDIVYIHERQQPYFIIRTLSWLLLKYSPYRDARIESKMRRFKF